MQKTIITNLLKFSFAAGLIYWLVTSGKIDFSLLSQLMNKPLTIALIVIALQLDHMLVAFRLKVLIQKRAAKSINFLKLFISNWIGIFFNSVLPGSVTGDLIKIFYIQELDKNLTKKFLLISVLVDRVVGLIGLVLVGGITSLIHYKTLTALSYEVEKLVQVNIALVLGVFLTLGLIFFLPQLPPLISQFFQKKNIMAGLFNKLEEIWNDLCLFRNRLLLLIGLSVLVQSGAVLIFWYLTSPFAQGDFNLTTAFSIMPIGFISIAIPIAPAGLGVGHAVFDKLLGFFSITNGASLFNIYFFIVMFSNLTGVIPYILYPRKKKSVLKK
ncbi:MAG: flippase-like domain-containing protein [Halobacteriovoraceae bacterium]|jgi:glycosyltransferase 2 family protein|nr:flippase-like domain-containing protein [Halobacteriovoraceae bacterium]